MAQPASKVGPDGPKWTHLEPLLPTLAVPLRDFTHFWGRAFARLKGRRRQGEQPVAAAPKAENFLTECK